MPFDLAGARRAGYSDDEIAGFLAQREGFDLAGATGAGYSTEEVIGFLASEPSFTPAPADGLELTPTASTRGGSEQTFTIGSEPDGVERAGAELGQLRDEVFSVVDQAGAALRNVVAAKEASRLQRVQRQLQAVEQRGRGDTMEAQALRRQLESARGRLPELVGEAAEANAAAQRGAQMVTRPAVQKVAAAKTLGEAWEAFKEAPYDVIAGVTAQSLPHTLPALIAAALTGPGAGAVAMGLSSGSVEFGSSLTEFARASGVDPRDAKALQAFYNDPAKLSEALSYAGKRAGIIGAVDAASGGIASKTLAPPLRSAAARQAVNMPAQLGVQAAAGAGGEAGAQLATKGRIDEPGQVLLEAAGELGTAPAEVMAFTGGQKRPPAAGETPLPAAPQPAPMDPVAAIQQAPTVDDAIDAAEQAIEAQPLPGPARQESAQAVDEIGRILGYQPEAAPVSREPVPGLPDAEPLVWTGRRGDGYETQAAAADALPSRQKVAPDRDWRIEQRGDRFVLAGYPVDAAPQAAQNTADGQADLRQSAAGEGTPGVIPVPAGREGLADAPGADAAAAPVAGMPASGPGRADGEVPPAAASFADDRLPGGMARERAGSPVPVAGATAAGAQPGAVGVGQPAVPAQPVAAEVSQQAPSPEGVSVSAPELLEEQQAPPTLNTSASAAPAPITTETPAPAGVSASEDRFPPVERFDGKVNVGPAGLRKVNVVAPGQPTYRETDIGGLDDRMREDRQAVPFNSFVADRQELAIGQGTNRGVQLQFRAGAVSGREHSKPMTGDLAGREYATDLLAPRAVQAVTMFPADFKRTRAITRMRLAEDFDRQELPDGRLHFTRKGLPPLPAPTIEPIPFTRNPTGTLTVEGNEDVARRVLEAAGVTRLVRSKKGLLVGKSDADKAAAVLAKLAPQPERVESLGASGPKPAGGKNARAAVHQENPFKAFLGKHGLSLDLVPEFAPGTKERRSAMVRGYGPIFRKSGKQIDALAQAAVEEGFLPEADANRVYEMVAAALRGERIAPMFTADAAEQEMAARIERQRQLEEERAATELASLADAETAELAQNDDDIPWDAIGEPSTLADGLRALGATEQEIADAEAEVARRAEGARADAQGDPVPVEAAAGQAQGAARGREDQARGDQEGQGLAPPTEADALRMGLGDFTLQADKLVTQPGGTFVLLDGRRASYENGQFNVAFSWGNGKWSGGDTRRTPEEAYRSALKTWTDRGGSPAAFSPADRNLFVSGTQGPDLLTAPTEQDVLAQQRRREEGERAETQRQADEERRARADAERGEFTLTGSDRAADANPAQRDAFDEPMRGRAPKSEERNLIVQHKITQENVLHVKRLGGLAVPSIAITTVDAPLENFGEISLLGDVNMATPSRDTKVFGADIYSPRYPKVTHKLTDAQWKTLAERLDPYRQEGDGVSRWSLDSADLAESLISHKPFQRMVAAQRGVDNPNSIGYHDLRAAADMLLTDIGAQERIFQGYTYSGNRRYVPHTMDAVVKILKKEMRGGESFNYGVGSVRAHHTPQFRSIAGIRAAKGKLVPKTQFETVKEEVNNELFALADKLASFHPASNSFGFTDSVTMMLGDSAKMGIPRALEANGFEDVPQDVMQDVRDYIVKLRDLPTEYFEGKITRPVALSEFRAAVVPSTVQPGVRKILERAGLAIYEYDKAQEGDRARVVKQAAQETPDALFKRGDADPMPSGLTMDEARRQIRAMRGASVDKARDLVDVLAAGWKNAPKITVVQTAADLPGNNPPDVRGLYQRGHIWIVAGSHRDGPTLRRSVARTLAHEVVAHFGLRDMLGREGWARLMREIQLGIRAKNKELLRIQQIVREAYVNEDGSFALNPAQEADEIAARAVEEAIDADGNFRPGFAFLKAVWARVAQFLRDLGITVNFTNAELQGMLVLSMRNMETGKKTAGGGQLAVAAAREDGPMHHRAFHGTPHDFDRFSTEHIGTGEGAQAYGWGLYFAENEGVAENYRRTLSGGGYGVVTIDGKPQTNDPEFGNAMVLEVDDRPATTLTGDAGYAFMRTELEKWSRNAYQPGRQARAALQWLAEAQAAGKPIEVPGREQRGALYEVHIPDEVVSRMLLWDLPLSEQPENVKKAVREWARDEDEPKVLLALRGLSPSDRAFTGESLYRMFAEDIFKGPRIASEELDGMGIPGIKYLDAASRPKNVVDEQLWKLTIQHGPEKAADMVASRILNPKEREAARKTFLKTAQTYTSNLVVFNERHVEITHKNGKPVTRAERDDFLEGPMNARGGVADQTQTPEFRRWFGGSKVVDAEGKPLVVYHGTDWPRAIDAFKLRQEKAGVKAAYFTPDPKIASAYATRMGTTDYNTAPNVVPAYLALQNPLEVDGEGRGWGFVNERALEAAKKGKHDGIIISNVIDAASRETAYPSTVYIAFRPEQIKSAIGNRGTFDPFDADIRHARGATADEQQDEASEATPARTSPWRDAAGRLQFAPGAWLYDKLGAAVGPTLSKLQLKAASPELRRAMREMKIQVAKAQETAAAVAGKAMELTEEERAMVSDLIEQELDAGTVPPQHAVRLAAMINSTLGAQTDELVRLGMLTPESAEMWRGKYLPRFYQSKLGKSVGDAWADAMRRMGLRTKVMGGIKGKHLHGRGLYEVVPERELSHWEAMGWQVRDPGWQPGLTEDGTVQVWRDFTRAEREQMGEIRDAGFRFVMGYMQTQKDIALGRMFEALAQDPEMSSRRETEKFSVYVPDGSVPGTGAKRYGKLSGRWVSKDTMSHLSQIEEMQSEAWRMYRKALGIWKEGKTALNPVAHVNNTLSNMTMAHFAGVSYWEVHKYVGAAHDFATKGEGVLEAKDAGLFLGTLSEADLMNTLPEDLKALVRQQDSAVTKIGRTGFNVMTFFLRRPMGWAYQAEDTFFRYLIYRDARSRGMQPADAVDYAQKFIFTYDDLPKGARMLRDAWVPFFGYTYKVIPAMLETALTHPVRFATPAAVLFAANAISYAIATGEDEGDEWAEALHKYLNDPQFRERVREKEKLERELLPKWMRGTTALFTPRAIRLGMDELTKLPLFIDIARIIPGGDIFDVTANADGVPIPQWMMPSNPVLTTVIAMTANKDLYFGKELVDMNDTRVEATEKRLGWIWRQAAPAIAVGGYHWERGMNALAQASGGEVTWLPEWLSEDFTGIGRDGLPVQPKYAAAQTFGIKVRPLDLELSEKIGESQKRKMLRDIETELRRLSHMNRRGAISDKVYEREREKANLKKDRIGQGLTVDGDEQD